jgi:hypothetical protein
MTRLSLPKKRVATPQQLKRMNSRMFITAAVVIGLAGVVLGFALLQKGGQQKVVQRQKELEEGLGKVTEPMTSSIEDWP